METMPDFDPEDMVDKVIEEVGKKYTQEELEEMTKNESQKLEAMMQDMLEVKMKAFIEEMIAGEPGKPPEDSVVDAEAKETGPVKSEKASTPNNHTYGDSRFWTAPEQHTDDLAELMAEAEEGEAVCELVDQTAV